MGIAHLGHGIHQPVVFRVRQHLGEQGWSPDKLVLGLVFTRFDHADIDAGVLAQARGEGQARGTSPDNDVVVCDLPELVQRADGICCQLGSWAYHADGGGCDGSGKTESSADRGCLLFM